MAEKKRIEKQLQVDARQRLLQQTQAYKQSALNSISQGIGNDKKEHLVVSLTSFGPRINDVHLTIESLFQQSLKADRIVLCLAGSDFSPETLPEMIKSQQRRGLDVFFCEKDLGPYTKIFYTLKTYPDSLLVTVDDDILYPHDMLDLLYRAHVKNPAVIPCHRAHKMTFDASGKLLPYKKWEKSTQDSQPSKLIFPTGVGGVLYSPGCFSDDVFDKEVFLKLAPNADDVWLKAMSLKEGTLCQRIEDQRIWGERFPVIAGSQETALKRRNKSPVTGNDSKIQAIFDHYQLWSKLSPDHLGAESLQK